jgi:hypothetical protein
MLEKRFLAALEAQIEMRIKSISLDLVNTKEYQFQSQNSKSLDLNFGKREKTIKALRCPLA